MSEKIDRWEALLDDETKECSYCKRALPKNHFYFDRHNKDLLSSQCKFCISVKRSKPVVPTSFLIPYSDPRRLTAIRKITYAIWRKDIPHPKTLRCDFCGEPAYDYQHLNYDLPYYVKPLCKKHHAYYFYREIKDDRILES